MPLLRHRELACWERFALEGVEISDPAAVDLAEAPRLHVGFLNMMPDRALKATERQFLRLLAAGSEMNLVQVHPFTIPGLSREPDAKRYVSETYESFEDVRNLELDGLVLTGANPGNSEITAEKFWPHFEEVVHWANANVPAIFCSCLASHAILKIFHGIERTRCKPDKRWGVFSHQIANSRHPLMQDMPERYEEPRSHVFEMTARQLQPHGIEVLAASPEADFGIAVSEDGVKWVFLQGHPEYDAVSLLKEYKREINRCRIGERSDYPEFPLNYLPEAAVQRLEQFRREFVHALEQDSELPELPESDVLPLIDSPWSGHARILFRNWIRLAASLKGGIKHNAAQMRTA